MTFKDEENFHYRFDLKDDFIPIVDENRRRSLNGFIILELSKFISKEITDYPLNYSKYYIEVFSKDYEKIIKIKTFCRFIMEENRLSDITKKYLVNGFTGNDIDLFHNELSNFHKEKLFKELDASIIQKNDCSDKINKI